MSCCGKQRTSWNGKSPSAPRAQSGTAGVVHFRYLGNKAITLSGPATGRVYRFWGAGATVAAHPTDAPFLAGVPLMEQVSLP